MIIEVSEYQFVKVIIPQLSQIEEFEHTRLPKDVFRNIYNSFMAVWGKEKIDQIPNAHFDDKPVLLE